jgi:endonuclease YncB( thermonuclease family)
MSSENQPPPSSAPQSVAGAAPEAAPLTEPPSEPQDESPSESQTPGPPAPEASESSAWTRPAPAQNLRNYLVVALALAALAGSVSAWYYRAPVPVPATENPSTDELRQSQPSATNSLILAPNSPLPPNTPTIAMSPPPPSPSTGAPQSVPELPTVSVESPSVHPVPDESETRSISPATLSNRLGQPLKMKTNPALPPSYVPSVPGPGLSSPASSGPKSGAPQQSAMIPEPPLTGNPSVFSGRARALGGVNIEVAGLKVRLFGVRLPEVRDQCAAANGKPQACDAAGLAALQQRLAGHSIVACHVPPGQQSSEPGAVCLDEEGNDLGRYLVIQGYALADSNQSYDYLPAEGAARTAKRGLWNYR